MNKSLNFNNVKKEYLTITLRDENKTTIMVGTPTKSDLTELAIMYENLKGGENDIDQIDDLYNLCAKLMNRNKGGIKITAEHLSECMDVEDIMLFINAFMSFVNDLANAKN